RGSDFDSVHSKNRVPLPETTSRTCRQLSHRLWPSVMPHLIFEANRPRSVVTTLGSIGHSSSRGRAPECKDESAVSRSRTAGGRFHGPESGQFRHRLAGGVADDHVTGRAGGPGDVPVAAAAAV